MTDEEKAKEWVRTNSGYSTKEFHGQKAIEAFLAGLEAGKDMAELEKENAELKKDLINFNEDLTKAKELLTRFIMCSVYFNGKETDLVEEAEKFLRENE